MSLKNQITRDIYKVFDDHDQFLANQTVLSDQKGLNTILENLYSPGPSFQYIFDIVNRKFTFLSESLNALTGENPNTFQVDDYASMVHPDDFQHFVNCEEIAGYFLFSHIRKEEIPNYKVSYQIRFKTKNDEYKLFLRQSIALTLDNDYKLSTVFTNQSDIDHITTHNNQKVSFINIMEGKSYFGISCVDDLKNDPSKPTISNRETEILKLASEGFSSREIADYLHISLDTVRTHRKNILNKTEFKNLTQAIAHFVREGLI